MEANEALRQVGYYHSSRIIPLLFVAVAALLGSMITPHLSQDWELGRRQAVVRICQLAAIANARGAVERSLAGVLFRDSPRGGDRFHRRFARGLSRELCSRGIRPLALERHDGSPLFARRSVRIPPGLFIHALDRGGCLLIVIAIDCARIEAKTSQGFFELADIAAAGSGRHVAKSRCGAAEDKDRTAGGG